MRTYLEVDCQIERWSERDTSDSDVLSSDIEALEDRLLHGGSANVKPLLTIDMDDFAGEANVGSLKYAETDARGGVEKCGSDTAYEDYDVLLQSVESGAVAPLRGSWLLKTYRNGGRLARRQDLPPMPFGLRPSYVPSWMVQKVISSASL